MNLRILKWVLSVLAGIIGAATAFAFGSLEPWVWVAASLSCSAIAGIVVEAMARRGEGDTEASGAFPSERWRMEGSSVGEWELNCESDLVYCSKVLHGLLELPQDRYSFNRYELMDRILPVDRERFQSALEDVEENATIRSVDCRVRPVEEGASATRWIEVVMRPVAIEGKVTKVSGIVTDISSGKETEAQLVSERAALEAILENTDDIVISVDRDLRITALNSNFRALMKASYEARINVGDYLFAYTPPDVEALWMPRYRRALEGKTVRVEEDFRVKGRPFCFDVSLKPIRERGEVTGIAVYSRHVTEQKRREREWQAAKERAEESDRLKSAFLANMSHEIRTPLNAIMGFAQLLHEESIPEEERSRFLDIVLSNGNHLLRILSDIMDLAQIESNQLRVERERFDIGQVLAETKALFSKQVVGRNSGVRFELGNEPNQPDWITTDPTRLKQIIFNLISNAFKFTEEGYVRLSYRRVDEDRVEFSVADSGSGVSDESKRVIFERFSRGSDYLSTRKEGVGLGLSICQGIARLLGGDIWVEDNQSSGTVFKFTIRDCSEGHPRLETDELGKVSVPAGEEGIDIKGRVLVAEDDDMNFVVIEEFLKRFELECVRATNGKEAVRIVRRDPENVGLVLMDLSMPVMDGFAATREIKRLNPALPVIAHTAHAMKRDLEFARDAGCSDCLVKPVTLESFNELLRRIGR